MRPLIAAILLASAVAHAQPSSESKAAADTLFDEGKKLLAAGDVAHACPKFEASLKLVDQLGVRMNLADCYEKAGRTASAWAEFREAASQATKRGDARAKFATDRADALAPTLVKLQVDVPQTSRVPGLVVRRNGGAIPAEVYDSATPVDPGTYRIDASADGFKTWTQSVEVSKPGQTSTIEVPKLEANPEAPKPPPVVTKPEVNEEPVVSSPETIAKRHRRHVLGIGIGAGGLAAIGIGIGLGLEARSKWNSVGPHCDANHVCDSTGTQINHDARLYGNIGTGFAIAGGVAIAAGAVLYLTAPSVVEHANVEVGAHGAAASFSTRF
jgi:hypothetical protein